MGERNMLKTKEHQRDSEDAHGLKISIGANGMCMAAKKRIVMITTVVIAVLLLGTTAIVVHTYRTSVPSMVDGIVQAQNEQELALMLKTFNENVLELDRFAIQLNLDNSVRTLMNRETIESSDPAVLRIQKMLSTMKNENLWLHSAFVYYARQNAVISDSAVLPADQLAAVQQQNLQPTQLGEYRITGTHVIPDSAGENETTVISVLRFFPVYSSEAWGAVVMNIRIASIQAQLASLAHQEGGYVFLVNRSGTIELCSAPKYQKGNLNTLLKDHTLADSSVQFAGDTYRVYTNQPNYFDWRLVQLYPTDAVFAHYAAMDGAVRLASIGCALAGLLVLLGGWCFVRTLSRQQQMQEHAQLVMANQKDRFTDSLFYGLLHDHSTIDQTCREQMLLYEVPTECYAAVLLVFEDHYSKDISAELSGVMRQYSAATCLRWKPDAYVLLLNIPEKKRDAAQAYLTSVTEYLLIHIREKHSGDVKAYIGSVEEHLDDLRMSLAHAESAMDDRWLMENDHGIYCYTPRALPETMTYSEMLAQNVYAQIKGGQAESAVTTMQRMINTLCKENQFVPKAVRAGVTRFVTNLIQTVATVGNLKEYELMKEYSSLKCLADVRVWLTDLIQKICQIVQALYSTTGSSTSVEQIEQYIKSHLDKEITLSAIAAHFSVSESHFSRMFKQKFGVNFLEYVNRQRIDNAKRILDIEPRTVNEVAIMVGFTNVQTFIRVFKSLEGMTPGVYQNMRKTIVHS